MDYETLNVLYLSRKTLLKILESRGYVTKAYEKFGPIEISAMASASTGAGATAFRMDLQRPTAANGITRCRVEYSINRVKNRISGFLEGIVGDENENPFDPATTELIVVLLEPVVEAFHTASMTALASKSLRVNFFQAHTIVNNPMDHVLVPKHELLPASEHAEFLAKNKIKKANIPLIKFHEDMIARVMGLQPGDIVKIIRPSQASGEYISYRICVP
jgi:DNA-directed RNA polymerase subunit H (RpoH/RPB5)